MKELHQHEFHLRYFRTLENFLEQKKADAKFSEHFNIKFIQQANATHLADCLSKDYNEIIIIAHGKGKKERFRFQYLNHRQEYRPITPLAIKMALNKAKNNSALKSLRILSCDGEEFHQAYPTLSQWLKDKNVLVEFAPQSDLVDSIVQQRLRFMNIPWVMESFQYPQQKENIVFQLKKNGSFYSNAQKTIMQNEFQVDVSSLYFGFDTGWKFISIPSSYFQELKAGETKEFSLPAIDLDLFFTNQVIGKHSYLPNYVRDYFNYATIANLESLSIGVQLSHSIKITKKSPFQTAKQQTDISLQIYSTHCVNRSKTLNEQAENLIEFYNELPFFR